MKTTTYCVKNLLNASQIYFMRWAGSSARQSELNLPSKAPDSVSVASWEAKLLRSSCASRRHPGVAGSNPARPAKQLTPLVKERKRKMSYNNNKCICFNMWRKILGTRENSYFDIFLGDSYVYTK